LIGLFPSVIKKLFKPNPDNNLDCNSGPAKAIALIVSDPMASTTFLNLSDSISDNCFAFSISTVHS